MRPVADGNILSSSYLKLQQVVNDVLSSDQPDIYFDTIDMNINDIKKKVRIGLMTVYTVMLLPLSMFAVGRLTPLKE